MTLSVALRHRFGAFALDVAFEAPAGVTALFGRSGAGKTTVVQAVAGLLRPDAGRIAVDGRVLADTEAGVWLPPHKRRVGYVFQDARLFPHLSVRGNLTYGQRFAGGRMAPELTRVADLLGIGALLDRRPGGLSGGERQRVAIGRALLAAPEILLMDEPLAALDRRRKEEILPYLERLRDEMALPILYVSHALDEIARLATTLVVIEAGRVLRAGPVAALLSDPAALPVLGVREGGSVLDGLVVAHHADGLTELQVSGGRLLLPRADVDPGARLRVRVAASDVILARIRPEGISALNILEGEVTAVQPGTGPGVAVQMRIGDDLLLARITARSAEALGLAPGQRCFAVLKAVSVAPASVGVVGG